ncbi:E3 ubiquitin-protein ligase TRIM11-like isoform X2 [Lethenteron reissneri]|uniref:E3 ubiquitin-protein ligase TRIM11-like isoform X2 n=1 Tax=Lethenteron reissneri TaxID=7753 RepID=UPI002AB77DFC|nr:E3 ubiquitin-protein ligase TRIM11-like isoform X2 [Lethenteron reissneri]
MASAAPAQNVDRELTCSICLDTFDCPSTLSCGHSFCLQCLEDAWKEAGSYCCPQCRKTFPQRPQLTRNVTLANLIEQLRVTETMAAAAAGGVVFCDNCPEGKTLAVKTCLKCEMSFCRKHLAPHLERAKLKDHVLVSPDVNPEERKCKRHKQELIFYCKQDVSLVCTVCAFTGEHRGHDVDTLENEHKTRKGRVGEEMRAVEKDRKKVEASVGQMKATRKAVQVHLKETNRRDAQKGSPPSSPSEKDIAAISTMQGAVVNLLAFMYGRSLTVDPNSAHNKLQISSDLRTVTRTAVSQGLPNHPHRFYAWSQALCSQSFSSGQHYWEVDVGGAVGICEVGVTYGTIARKGSGKECELGRNDSSWVLCKNNNSCSVWHGGVRTSLPVRDPPRRVGCHLHWEAGLLSFYRADSMELLHSIHHSFSQPLCPALSVFDDGNSVRILDLSRAS